MKKIKILYLIILLAIITTLAGCDQINKFKDLVPKFEGNLPNVISGPFVYFEDEKQKEENNYDEMYTFNSKTMTFTKTTDKDESGTYSYKYDKFNITECSGEITLTFEDGRSETHSFYYVATAVDGPDFIRFDKGKTYYYWGT